jgi:hypothetical protein
LIGTVERLHPALLGLNVLAIYFTEAVAEMFLHFFGPMRAFREAEAYGWVFREGRR